MTSPIDWLDAIDVGRILDLSPESVRRMAKRLGGIKVRRGLRDEWRFEVAIVRAFGERRALANRSVR